MQKNSKKERLKLLKQADQKLKREKKSGKKRKKHSGKGIKIALGTVVLLLAAGYGVVGFYYKDKFYPGTEINENPCGGKDVAYIKEIIKKSAENYTLTIKEKK